MKYFFSLVLLSGFLAACAGNPPAWWNPNNRYGTAQNTSATTAVRPVKKTVIQDETIDIADTSYEEEIIAPLPEEELPAPSDAVEISAQTQPVATQAGSAKAATQAQPVQTGLPVPSVLE